MKLNAARKTSESMKAYRKRRASENLKVENYIKYPQKIWVSTRHELVKGVMMKTGHSTYIKAKHGLIGQDKLRA